MSDDGRELARARLRRSTPRERVFVDGASFEQVLDHERCERAFEQAEAERRREAWPDVRLELTERLRSEREAMPLPERVSRAQARIAAFSNLPARRIAAARSTDDESSPGGRRPPGSRGDEFAAYLTRIRRAIEDLEQALDVEEGIAPATAGQMATSAEKDRELLTRYAGVSAGDVARDRRDLGSQATVYRRRAMAGMDALGLDQATGLAPDEATVEAAVRRMNRSPSQAAA